MKLKEKKPPCGSSAGFPLNLLAGKAFIYIYGQAQHMLATKEGLSNSHLGGKEGERAWKESRGS